MATSTALTALEEAGAIVSDTSLLIQNPEKLSWEKYENLGHFLGGLGRGYPWWVGDFLNTGEDVFGEEFAQIEASFPHSPQTLANYKSVAKHVPPQRRRGLHMSLVSEVAYLPPDQRDALIAQAVAGDWKREEMREARRAMQREAVGELPPAREDRQLTKCPQCGHTWEEKK